MELHMVFYKKEYESVATALKYDDGLAVLAFFYEVNRSCAVPGFEMN